VYRVLLYITFLIAMQCSPNFSQGDTSEISNSCLLAPFTDLWQRQDNRAVVKIKSYEERETPVYDCSLYGHRPASY
jgi:hypothetical protein